MTFKPSPFESLQAANPDAEIWWDSSPQIFGKFRDTFLSTASTSDEAAVWRAQLNRFFDPERPTEGLVRGITTNPSLIASWIQNAPEEWTPIISEAIARQHRPTIETTYQLVYQTAITRAAGMMLPLWSKSKGKYGWVSGQTDPRIMFDYDAMLEQALGIARTAPNVMLKIPGTQAGYRVIEELTARGISTNSTLSYTVPQFLACIQAVERGLAKAYTAGVDTSRWRSVITHMIGRFGTMNGLGAEAEARGIPLSESDTRWAELAILKRANSLIRRKGHPCKMLLSSLKVDKRNTPDSNLSMHLEHTAGANIAYTCKPDFIADILKDQDRWQPCTPKGIDSAVPEAVMARLLQLPSFRKSYEPDGMTPVEFAATGAFLGTFMEVNENTRRLIHHIGLAYEHDVNTALAGAA
ncbi:transaldolase family protein [Puniceibacterium sediminis]|uniref:Transaldolase n=1 Tax=Puniceibacterium sediminis TaxID=1608407 RepID=A0A238YSX9_9RHOB|nr:transaldolase family protein [Puniceibacterium sediminis]SNR74386.1 transaldolase [Puniceibacterium sediminis]